jgi:hypothetical protein
VSQSQSGPPACAGECHLVRVRSVLADPGSPVMCYPCVTANWLVRAPQADWAAGAGRRAGAPAVVLHGARRGPGMLMRSTILVYYRRAAGTTRSTSTRIVPRPFRPGTGPASPPSAPRPATPAGRPPRPLPAPEHQSRRRTARLSRPAPRHCHDQQPAARTGPSRQPRA